MNLYQGMNMNPQNYVDPMGLLLYSWNYLGIFAGNPNGNPGWQSLNAFPYGNIYNSIGNNQHGIYISQSVTLNNMAYNDILLSLYQENNKYYPRFNFFMTTMIYLHRDYSKPYHVQHEKTHMAGKQLLFLETLFKLKNAESIGYDSPEVCLSASRKLIEEVHPLRRWSNGHIPDWYPIEGKFTWLNDNTLGFLSERLTVHYKIWKRFAENLNVAQVAYDIWNFDEAYRRNQSFSISNYRLGSRQQDFDIRLNLNSMSYNSSR